MDEHNATQPTHAPLPRLAALRTTSSKGVTRGAPHPSNEKWAGEGASHRTRCMAKSGGHSHGRACRCTAYPKVTLVVLVPACEGRRQAEGHASRVLRRLHDKRRQ